MLAILLLKQLKKRRSRLDIDKGGKIEDLQKEKVQKETDEAEKETEETETEETEKETEETAEGDKLKDAYP